MPDTTTERLLYDLAGIDDVRFSPYCWRSKMALLHKGLSYETEACGYGDIPGKLSFGGYERIPVLNDSGTVVADSWDIANHLEDAYPDTPTLFGGAAGRAQARFFNIWTDLNIVLTLVPAIVADIFELVREEDRGYFKLSREARFGRDLETMRADRAAAVERYRAALQPVRLLLGEQPFIAGDAPLYVDLILMGSFMSARCTSTQRLLAEDDPVDIWFQRMLDQYDGYLRQVPERAVAAG